MRKSAAKAIRTIVIIFLMIIPLAVGAGYIFWSTASDKDGSAYKFFAGLFGDRNDSLTDIRYAYNSQYDSARPINPNFKSPIYVLTDSILEDIPSIDYTANLPKEAVRELYMPAGLRYEGTGLFMCYIDDNGKFGIKKCTSRAGLELFDPAKPTFLFIHGMQYQNGAFSDENSSYLKPYIQAGYNVLLFRWSQFTDESTPMDIEPKLWGSTKNKDLNIHGMRWKNEKNVFIDDDIPNASMSEIFGAYYIDLMSRFNYSGSMIQFSGHSMGGQLLYSAMSYLLAKEQEGLISPALLPDKITAFDPYFAPFKNEIYCPWLGINISRLVYDDAGNPVYFPKRNEQKYTSAINVVADTANALKERGIACEFVPSISGYVHALMRLLDPNEPAVDKFMKNCVVLEFRTDWVDVIGDFNGFHGAGKDWYFESILHDYLYDYALNNPTDISPTAKIPLSYFYARTGTVYKMEKNMTLDIEDDVIFSDNINSAKIAGFAFNDANGNNIYDERLQARMAGVKVELYIKDGRQDKLIATRITNQSGFYSFDIPRIYANGFDDFFIRVVPAEGYKICGRGSNMYMMNNDINPTDNRSDTISLNHYKNLKILNIGMVKEA